MPPSAPMPSAGQPNGPGAGREYFERLHHAQADPWHVRTSEYEREKLRTAMAVLPRSRYRLAFEPGCSIGEITRALAQRCDMVVAADFAPAAIRSATRTCAGLRNIRFVIQALPSMPRAPFDLIVFSEVLNYLSAASLTKLAEELPAVLAPGGHVLLVHHKSTRPGQEVPWHLAHLSLVRLPGTCHLFAVSAPAYQLDLLEFRLGE